MFQFPELKLKIEIRIVLIFLEEKHFGVKG